MVDESAPNLADLPNPSSTSATSRSSNEALTSDEQAFETLLSLLNSPQGDNSDLHRRSYPKGVVELMNYKIATSRVIRML